MDFGEFKATRRGADRLGAWQVTHVYSTSDHADLLVLNLRDTVPHLGAAGRWSRPALRVAHSHSLEMATAVARAAAERADAGPAAAPATGAFASTRNGVVLVGKLWHSVLETAALEIAVVWSAGSLYSAAGLLVFASLVLRVLWFALWLPERIVVLPGARIGVRNPVGMGGTVLSLRLAERRPRPIQRMRWWERLAAYRLNPRVLDVSCDEPAACVLIPVDHWWLRSVRVSVREVEALCATAHAALALRDVSGRGWLTEA